MTAPICGATVRITLHDKEGAARDVDGIVVAISGASSNPLHPGAPRRWDGLILTDGADGTGALHVADLVSGVAVISIPALQGSEDATAKLYNEQKGEVAKLRLALEVAENDRALLASEVDGLKKKLAKQDAKAAKVAKDEPT